MEHWMFYVLAAKMEQFNSDTMFYCKSFFERRNFIKTCNIGATKTEFYQVIAEITTKLSNNSRKIISNESTAVESTCLTFSLINE